jgi:sugar phosphate isomerase/epimerase
MKIGAQLYTVKKYAQNLEDFEQTLKRISEIGFRYVQVSGVCEFTPEWLKEKLEKYNLKCVLTHVKPPNALLENPQKTCDDHSVFGCDYIGLGSMPRLWNHDTFTNDDVVDKFIEEYLPVMKTLKANGKYLMYHNHSQEFDRLENGEYIWDALANRIPTDLMGFILDTYWIQYGGKNPAKEIKKLKGRLPCVHFKDYKVVRGGDPYVRFAPVGSGNLDWDEIISACESSDVKYVLIEQDNCFDEDPFECLKSSFEFLKSKGLDIE